MSAEPAAPRAVKDPFYRQLLAGLEGHLDDQTFEAAVCDLLRDAFPSLVPIPGGSDRGMDGGIADAEGEAFPLVCTIRKDVIGNLSTSLDSILASGKTQRKVVLVTSRALTPKRRSNLEKRAAEKGFALIQVFEQRALADRLYRSSRWLQELLGLTGAPSALSAVPLTRRPLVEIPLIGREKELEWLNSTSGDRLISGQPGSGKTFLLTQLVRERGWLFLVSDDEAAIAAALRDQQPGAVIVDDAHTDPSRLDRLRHLREEQGAKFDIVATTWPGEKDAVLSALGSPAESQVLKLELMPRRDIKALLEHLGIHEQETGPALVCELIEQAANKPGLAATLALVWLRGEWQNLMQGKTIDQALIPLFEERVGQKARGFLASFALGGSRGLSLQAVASAYGLDLLEAQERAARLAAGGVLKEAGRGTLVVEPRVLRAALVRSIFFPDEGPALPCEALLAVAHAGAAAEVLAEAMLRGAKVPSGVLRNALLRADPREEVFQIAPRAWSLAAQVSSADAEWVIEHYPGGLVDVARAALEAAPDMAITRLLETEAVSGEAPSFQTRPLSLLSSWVQQVEISSASEALWRRSILARQAKAFLAKGGCPEVGIRALLAALSPRLQGSSLDALGESVLERHAVLPGDTLRAIVELWEEIRAILPPLDSKTWPHMSNFLWPWLYPRNAARGLSIPAESEDLMRSFAVQVLTDLSLQANGRPGIGAGLVELARRIGLQLPIAIEPVFSLLYPDFSTRRKKPPTVEAIELEELAEEWQAEPPETVAGRLATYEAEATIIGRQGSLSTADLCWRLASRAAAPEQWFEAFVSRELPGRYVEPFLSAILSARKPGWDAIALRSLDSGTAELLAFDLLLKEPDLPDELVQATMVRAPQFSNSVETLALNRKLPIPTLLILLRHSDPDVALAAAVGEWNAELQGEVRPEVRSEWREAILRAGSSHSREGQSRAADDYWLAAILAADPELSLEWWQLRARENLLPDLLTPMDSLSASLCCLSLEQRRVLLGDLPACSDLRDLLPAIVDRREDLFAALLLLPRPEYFHLYALQGKPDASWADLASLAVKHGYSVREVAGAAFLGHHTTRGSGLDYWQNWETAFGALESDPRPEVREVATEGKKIALAHVESSLEKQRKFDLHGW